MSISSVSNLYSTQPLYSAKNAYSLTSKEQSNATPQSSTALDTSSGVIDFTNITPQKFQSTMNALIKSGKLSLDETSPLVVMVPTALSKVAYDGQAPTAYAQPNNFISMIQNGIDGAKSRNDTANVQSLTVALHALQKLQGTSLGIDTHA